MRSSNPTVGYKFKENENTNLKDTCTPMFIAAFIIHEMWIQPVSFH